MSSTGIYLQLRGSTCPIWALMHKLMCLDRSAFTHHVVSSFQVSEKYKMLLQSENYVTRRMSLKMLGELLVERSNFTVM